MTRDEATKTGMGEQEEEIEQLLLEESAKGKSSQSASHVARRNEMNTYTYLPGSSSINI